MRFKNEVGEGNLVLPDISKLMLSDSEYNKYNTDGLYKENVVKTPGIDFKISNGKYVIIINDVEYSINVKEIQSEFYAVEVTLEDKVKFTIEKLREINKYDVIRFVIQNLKNIKEEKEYVCEKVNFAKRCL